MLLTEYHRLGGLEQQAFTSQSSRSNAGRLVSVESPFHGSETAVFLLYPHMVEGIRKLSGVPFIGGTNSIPEGSTLMT